MKLEWDLHELTDFGADLKGFGSAFNPHIKQALQEIARALLKAIKSFTPVGDTYQLMSGWDGNDFAIKPVTNGYEVLLVNTDEKALWVNDGHKARNQYGGPYEIHHRVKVTSPYQWQKGDTSYYVFGHFFVERGILQLSNTQQIEQIIMKKLQKWWNGI